MRLERLKSFLWSLAGVAFLAICVWALFVPKESGFPKPWCPSESQPPSPQSPPETDIQKLTRTALDTSRVGLDRHKAHSRLRELAGKDPKGIIASSRQILDASRSDPQQMWLMAATWDLLGTIPSCESSGILIKEYQTTNSPQLKRFILSFLDKPYFDDESTVELLRVVASTPVKDFYAHTNRHIAAEMLKKMGKEAPIVDDSVFEQAFQAPVEIKGLENEPGK